MTIPLLSLRVEYEHDVVAARQRARQIAGQLGFADIELTRIATAVSEIVRNAFAYGGGGRVEFRLEGAVSPQLLTVMVVDGGSGIRDVDEVLSGRYQSPTGMGIGLVGARRLMDRFEIDTGPGGTVVTVGKLLPRRTPLVTGADAAAIAERLVHARPRGPLEEVQQQNRELVFALDELRARQEELERVNRELEDTNRGVVALYAELDERADHLRRADELKTRFLSNMTHEFRTPVNSILALSGLLAERLATRPDQKDEVYFIRKAAQQLAEIVDDLLDIAKVEAGKIDVRPAVFEVDALFGALRGMLRPLLVNQSLSLVFEDADQVPPLYTDESKLSQILRNFISNALKYTERGEVRVTARLTAEGGRVRFAVADTGIGIPAEHLDRVFEEFVQIENPLQRRTKGTGLGLPLSKRLAELLGGQIGVDSAHGVGSTFWVEIPIVHLGRSAASTVLDPGRLPVLVVEDTDEDMLFYERALLGSRYQLVPARTVQAANSALDALTPAAILLDIRMHGEDTWDLLARVRRDIRTASIPLVVISTVDDSQKGLALGATAYGVKPIERSWLVTTLDAHVAPLPALRVLAADDEESARFILREMLQGRGIDLIEAVSGVEVLRKAAEVGPDVMLLDVQLGDMTGLDVCERLRERGARTPIVLVTSQQLSPADRERAGGAPVLSKGSLTRDTLLDAIQAATAVRAAQ
jgi:signal transduction histidine kinase/CheY-like chemotaxis protein